MEGSDNNINKSREKRKMRKTIIIIQQKENYNNVLNKSTEQDAYLSYMEENDDIMVIIISEYEGN